MENEELFLLNTCTDLVTLRRHEAFPLHVLGSKPPGEWVGVRDACHQVGIDLGELKPDLFVTWLAAPVGNPEYALLFFYDEESKWTMAAQYNRQRLLNESRAGLREAVEAPAT